MGLKTLVKVGEINNLSDARYCAGMGVDFVGFVLDTESIVSPELYMAITQWIEGIRKVGEFNTSSKDEIEALHLKLNFDFIQVNSLDILKALNVSCPKILKITINQSIEEAKSIMEEAESFVEYFLLESSTIEELNDNEARLLDQVCKRRPVLLGYGLNASTIERTLDYINPLGFALKGGNEIRPGYKNYDDLGDILEKLEIEF